jgi:hypothetical protein
MLKIFVGPVMGGLNPHQHPREYATGGVNGKEKEGSVVN